MSQSLFWTIYAVYILVVLHVAKKHSPEVNWRRLLWVGAFAGFWLSGWWWDLIADGGIPGWN